MTITVKHKVWAKVTTDTDQRNGLWCPDETLAVETYSNMQRFTSGVRQIDASGTETLPLGDLTTVRLLYIEVDGNADVTISGADTAYQLRPADTATGRQARLFMEAANITSVPVQNPSGTAALDLRYFMVGDPTS